MKNFFTKVVICLMMAGIITACKKEIDTSPFMRVVAVADFTATIQAPDNLTVKLANKSKNAKELVWDFGDKSPVSNDPEPTHTYTTPGEYTITLTIKSATGNESTKSLKVTTKPVDVIPEINFQYAADAGNILKVKFSNTSKNGITFSWDFGDGTPVSTEESPEHVFAAAGKYSVTLTAISATGNDNSRLINIRVPKLNVPEMITIANPSFELDPKDSYVVTGWDPVKESYPGSPGWGGFFIAERPKTGTRGLLFWTPSVDPGNGHKFELAYVGSVTQTITGLEDGHYTFKVWINSTDMEGMFLIANGGGADVKKAVGTNNGYTQLSVDFEVVGGKAKIGFLMDRPNDIGDNWSPNFEADDAELWINP
jgi:PKD repeat protein